MKWEVGQTVQVQSRTWAGINKPGGCAKITKIHRTNDGDFIEGLDVKYLVGGGNERNIDPAIVSPFETLERGGRKRRGRDFLLEREEDVVMKTRETTDTKETVVDDENENGTSQDDSPMNRATNESTSKECPTGGVAASLSRQSITTPYSTPQKRNRQGQKPKKVTPIPKMVKIGKTIDSISPMTEETSPSTSNKDTLRKSSVARGLKFEQNVATTAGQKNNQVQEKKKILSKNEGSMSTERLDDQNQQSQRPSTEDNTASEDDDERKPPAITNTLSTPIQKPSAVENKAVTSSSTKKSTIGVRLISSAGISMGITKRAMKPSFARTTSAYNKSNISNNSKQGPSVASHGEINRKPLLDVYREEVKKAHEFMDEMVGPPANNNDNRNLGESGSKENAHFIRTTSRYDEFLSTLRNVWMRVDDEEVSEEQFKNIFNELTSNAFTKEEIDRHIDSLCDEGKLMKSDGVLYKID